MNNYEEIIINLETVNDLSDDYIYYLIEHIYDDNNYYKINDILCFTKKYNQLFLNEIITNSNSTLLGIYIDYNNSYDPINNELLSIVLKAEDMMLAFSWAYHVGTHADKMLNILLNHKSYEFTNIVYGLWLSHGLYNPNVLKYKILNDGRVKGVISCMQKYNEKYYDDYNAADVFYSTLPDYIQLNINI